MATAVYARISNDRDGQRAGVERQEADCRREAERRAWEIFGVYVDNDISAFNGDLRPEYERLVADIEAGTVRRVIAWAGDRLHRNLEEYLVFEKLVRRHGVEVAFVRGGDWTVESADGRLSARLVGVVAQHESEKKSERITAGLLQAAQQGRAAGGNRPFGYHKANKSKQLEPCPRCGEQDADGLCQPEADLIRDGVTRFLSGAAIPSTLAREWGMHPWNVVRILKSPRIAGLREHHGQTYPARWPAIVTPEEHETLEALLHRPVGPRTRSFLLTGLAVCGSCGSLLESGRPQGRRVYKCRVRTPGTCPRKVARRADRSGPDPSERGLEEFVRDAALAALASEDFREALRGHQDNGEAKELAETLAGYRARLSALEADYVDGGIDLPTFKRMKDALGKRIEEAKAALARTTGHRVMATLPAGSTHLTSWWEVASFEQRHALLREVIERVVVHPTTPGNRKFDPSTVEIHWRA